MGLTYGSVFCTLMRYVPECCNYAACVCIVKVLLCYCEIILCASVVYTCVVNLADLN